MALAVLAAGLFGHAVDFLHARWVERRYRVWSEGVERDQEGIRMGFQPIEAGDGDTGILFVHGFAGSPNLFRFFLPHFAERGFVCRAIRLPGFGEEAESAALVSHTDWMAAVREEAAKLREGRDAVWIVGHSLGATLALCVAQENPALVDGLILLAPLIEISDERSPVLGPDDWFQIGQHLLVHTEMIESLFPVDAHDPGLREEEEVRDRFIPLQIYTELFATMERLGDPGDVPYIPLMMALAERDQIVDTARAQAWFQEIDAPQKKLWVAEPAGHVLPLDTGWEELLNEIDSFIQENR